jgi:alpha-tubulin suppressor-like RCC1 family protein
LSPSPTELTKQEAISQIVSGSQSSCALGAGGIVYCWGTNFHGSLGIGVADQSMPSGPPQLVHLLGSSLPAATALGAGVAHFCAALSGDAGIACWGADDHSQLGDGQAMDSDEPTMVIGLPSAAHVLEIKAGLFHSCALLSTGEVWCWGSNLYGELGRAGIGTVEPLPGKADIEDVVEILSLESTMFARRSDGTIWMWGRSDDGEFGDATTAGTSTPIQLAGFPAPLGRSSREARILLRYALRVVIRCQLGTRSRLRRRTPLCKP